MVINLSTYQLKREEISLLEKGLNFIPTPQIEHQAKIVQDFLLYERKCRLYHRFHKEDENEKDEEDVVEEEDELSQNILKVNKGWTPHDNLTDPNILAYKSVCLHNLKKNMTSKIKPRFNLKKKERQAIKSLKKNNKIVIKPADKGGAIVIMNREDYKEEGMRQLKRTEHYKKLENQKSEIKNFINTVKEDLDKIVEKGLISKEMRNMLYRENPRTSNLYLLPKIHKANNPGRPIINSIGSITEPLSAYVDQILRKYSKKCESYIKDTSHFLNIVKDIKTEEGAILCTIDVSALYTNIPHKEGISRCDQQLEKLGATENEREICKIFLNLILTNNYFEFFDETYLQISGTAMGTRCAPNYAILFMANLEEEMLSTSPMEPIMWKRYIDDIFLIWNRKEEELTEFLIYLNSYHSTIKFTEEHSAGGIPFLDTFVFIENNQLKTRLYRKPTDNKQYLHYSSCHPKQHKDAIPFGLLVRAKRICTEKKDFEVEATRILRTLHQRGYPPIVLEKALTRISDIDRDILLKPRTKTNDERIRYIMTYNPSNPDMKTIATENLHLMEKMRRNPIGPEKIQIVYRKATCLKQMIVTGRTTEKPKLDFKCTPCKETTGKGCKTCPRINKSNQITNREKVTFELRTTGNCQNQNVVYCLTCKCCNKNYIGETQRTMNLRMRDHESCIKTKKLEKNPVAEHFNQMKKTAQDYTVTLLDTEKDKNKRLRLEEAWIFCMNTLQPAGLNTKV